MSRFLPRGRGALLHSSAGSSLALGRPRICGGVHQEDQPPVEPGRASAHLEHGRQHVQG